MPPRSDQTPPLHVDALNADAGPETLEAAEWLLTNSLSGFAMGTASGIPTRRYHGLLTSDSDRSPQRRVYVNAVVEQLVLTENGTQRVEQLSSFRFRAAPDDSRGMVHPPGAARLVRFEKHTGGCRWEYAVPGATVVKRLAITRRGRASVVEYTVTPARGVKAELRLRPLVSLRDFHSLLRRDEGSTQFSLAGISTNGCEVKRTDGSANLFLNAAPRAGADVQFHHEEQWWYNFLYPIELSRGLDGVEDLFSPGEFFIRPGAKRATIEAAIVFAVDLPPANADTISCDSLGAPHTAARTALAAAALKNAGIAAGSPDATVISRLAVAADDFVFARPHPSGAEHVSIIAGYPWFADWGRDSTIALQGLLEVTGRHDDALHVLRRFAAATRNGIVPNRFADESGEPLYNTVDASLWFIVACWRYALATSRDSKGTPRPSDDFTAQLLPACLDIVDSYRRGTDFAIGMDPHDSLIAAGSEVTQLTWMDAMRDGIVFTPRHGKAVEINALWHNALVMLAELTAAIDPIRSADLRALAETVATSFRSHFWNPARNCCYDVLTRRGNTWEGSPEIRPNQIFAVSLPHSPLTPTQQAGVVRAVRTHLLTPYGLRTLEPGHPAYHPRFRGELRRLDEAYHNGTAWPWLIGPFAEAVMRVDNFSDGSRADAKTILRPLGKFLDSWCLGQLPEVFDAEGTPEDPQRPGGCCAQAWSVAEVLRAWVMAETNPKR